MSVKSHAWLGLLILFIIFAGIVSVYAQDDAEPVLIYACIDPVNEPTEDPSDAYLIIFRNTSLFGLIVPEASHVMIYSTNTLRAGMYAIAPDMASGGYRRVERLATTLAVSDVPSERLCDGQYAEINDDLLATIPLPVTSDHAVLIQEEDQGIDVLDDLPFLGIFSFHMQPALQNLQYNFQIIQLAGGGIELRFPFFPNDVEIPYLLVANKDVSVRKSFAAADTVFSAATPSDDRPLVVPQLSLVGLDLFQIMDNANARIYPSDGLYNNYPGGGYLRLEISQNPAVRRPVFEVGANIVPVEGATADYYLISVLEQPWITTRDEPWGQFSSISTNNTLPIFRVDEENGQIIIQDPNGQGECIVEAWLVEVVPPESP